MLIHEVLTEGAKSEKRLARQAAKEKARSERGSNIDVSNISKVDTSNVKQATGVNIMSSFAPSMRDVISNDINADDINEELKQFFQGKQTDITSQYNSKDVPFKPNSPLKGYMHAHLPKLRSNNPLVLIYNKTGTTVNYFMVVLHSDYENQRGVARIKHKLHKAV